MIACAKTALSFAGDDKSKGKGCFIGVFGTMLLVVLIFGIVALVNNHAQLFWVMLGIDGLFALFSVFMYRKIMQGMNKETQSALNISKGDYSDATVMVKLMERSVADSLPVDGRTMDTKYLPKSEHILMDREGRVNEQCAGGYAIKRTIDEGLGYFSFIQLPLNYRDAEQHPLALLWDKLNLG